MTFPDSQRDVFPFKKTAKDIVQGDNPKLGRQQYCSSRTYDRYNRADKSKPIFKVVYSHAFRGKAIFLLKCTVGSLGYPSALPRCGCTSSSEPRATPGFCYTSMSTHRELQGSPGVHKHTGSCGGGEAKGVQRSEQSEGQGRPRTWGRAGDSGEH